MKSVTLRWENQPIEFPEQYGSVIEASSDLQSWTEVARVPYKEGTNEITLKDRPDKQEFYRAYNYIT
jgi:hypothetical protein